MNPSEPCLESPIEEKISWARRVLQYRMREFLRDAKLAENLRTLREAVLQSRDEMAQLGIGDYCRACEEKEGGSCCGRGIEKHYTPSLLLLNLLLGVEIPESREDPLSCFFLSDNGCRLLARHVICVNFLCQKITSRIDPRKLAALREKEGVELNLVFSRHEDLRKKLHA
jgi:hypothetical protein